MLSLLYLLNPVGFATQAVMFGGLLVPIPGLLAFNLPNFETLIAAFFAVGAAWRIIKEKMGDPVRGMGIDDGREEIRKLRQDARVQAQEAKEVREERRECERQRRHLRELVDEQRKRLDAYERLLEGEGDRNPPPRERGQDDDRTH